MEGRLNKKTVRRIPEENCTGCGACYNICPAGAITMKAGSEGFLFPEIDARRCVYCSKCLKVCQAAREPSLREKQDCYALALKDSSLRGKSSSGGAFTLLASYVLDRGGMVCGAVFSEDYSEVYHCWAGDKSSLGPMRGSKYVQSDTRRTYAETKDYLKAGRYVLYTGTPCQIYGLRCFLGCDHEKLITADIVCHGVPSPYVYKKYLSEIRKDRSIVRLDFRDKEKWGWGTATSLFFSDGTAYYNDCYKDPYWRSFLSGLSTRKSCGSCRFASIHRTGDLTIGDFWGVFELDKSCDDGKGTSLLLVNSTKGKRVFREIRSGLLFCRQFPAETVYELAKRRNGQLIGAKKPHELRPVFFEKIAEGAGFHEAFDCVTRLYDVGYVGWWDSKNYGSALTAFAMNRTLRSMGKSVIMLEHPGLMKGAGLEQSNGIRFARKYYTCSEITEEKDYYRFNHSCRSFLVGSDQLWNWWNINQADPDYFFLNFAGKDKKKIAYAASFGMDHTDFPEDMRLKAGYYLSRFDHISTREKSGTRICREVFDVEADHVLDPVFLCPEEDYREVISSSEMRVEGPYLFSYILDPTEDKLDLVRYAAEAKGLSYRIAIDELGKEDYITTILRNDRNIMAGLRIEDWLNLLYNSSYVVTDSFHGLCFSTIFGKQVIAYVNANRGEERFLSIAGLFQLEDRLVYSSEEAVSKGLTEKEIDYEKLHAIMEENRKMSMDWLRNALESPKREVSVKELNRRKVRELDMKLNDLEKRIRDLEPVNYTVLWKIRKVIRNRGLKECLKYVKKKGIRSSLDWLKKKE